MKERPIVFKQPHADEMVRSILDGRKTQHRVPMKPQPNPVGSWLTEGEKHATTSMIWCEVPDIERFAKKPKWRKATPPLGTVGDRLWVRETWTPFHSHGLAALYKADCDTDGSVPYLHSGSGGFGGGVASHKPSRWTPSIHMPRWASRIDLEITRVWVERVQDITPEDCRSEGIQVARCGCEVCARGSSICTADAGVYLETFRDLWQSIYGTWDANPFVWAYEFRRVKP